MSVTNKTAILGAKGFLGSHLHKYLGQQTIEISRVSHGDFFDCSPHWFSDADTVVHIASGTPQKRSEHLFVDNVNLAKQVLEAARDAGVKNFILVSSAAVYASSQNSLSEVRANPSSDYGKSMYAAERMADCFSRFFNVTIARVFNPYGVGGYGLVEKIISAKQRDSASLTIGNLAATRDYVAAEDVAHALCSLAGKSGIYNIGSGQGYRIDELLEVAGLSEGIHYTVGEMAKNAHGDRYVADISLMRAANIQIKPSVLEYIRERTQ